jgi:hypothetical protein
MVPDIFLWRQLLLLKRMLVKTVNLEEVKSRI